MNKFIERMNESCGLLARRRDAITAPHGTGRSAQVVRQAFGGIDRMPGFVEDACQAILLVLEKGVAGQIYNVGAHNEMSNLNLTLAILRHFTKGDEMIRRVSDRLGHDLRYAVNFYKLKQLGFKPRWSFEQGLAATVEWYRNSSHWWQELKRDKYTVK
ncbi:MAG: hypothetical protein WCO84_10025 [bacterium]